jgi:hypothetical protein
MDQESVMNESQKDKFNQLANSLNLDPNTREQTKLFYAKFCGKRMNPPSKYSLLTPREDFQIYVKMAIFFASRSMEMVTVKGERIRGVGINPMQIVDNGQINVERFRTKALENLELLGLPSAVEEDITRLLDQMFQVSNFYKKYEALMAEFKISHKKYDEDDCQDIMNNLKNVGWLLFITTRKHVLKSSNETFEAIFLIAVVVSFLFANLDENFTILCKGVSNGALNRDEVLDYISAYLKVRDKNNLAPTSEGFKSCLKGKLALEVGKSDLNQLDKLMSLQKRIDLLYQKTHVIEDIDERLFLGTRKKNFSPKNQSPIQR